MTQGIKAVAPTLATNVFAGAASCNIAIEFGAQGPNSTNAMSCASGTMAIGEGFRQIRDGYADVMICGGVEAPLNPLCYGAFSIIRAMSTRNDAPGRASRPFDRERDGFVMGEGAAFSCSRSTSARRRAERTSTPRCQVYAFCNDAHHMTAPRPDGSQAARAMRGALEGRGGQPARDRVRQRAREQHAAQRPDRDARHQERVRRSRGKAPGEQHEGVLWARPRRLGGNGGGDLRAVDRARLASADAQPRAPRRGLRSRLHPGEGTGGVGGLRAEQLVWLRRHQRGFGVARSA